MKAIILISSIFYILGLKISNKIDLIKRTNPVEKIITHTIKTATPEKSVDFKEEQVLKPEKDTVQSGSDAIEIE